MKLALVISTFLLGFYNWRRVRAAIEAGTSPERIRASALGQLALALLVLGVTAVLTLTPMPRSEAMASTRAPTPVTSQGDLR